MAARAFPSYEALMEGALGTAETIAGYSRVAVQACKEVVNKSQDLGVRDGVEFERRVFHSLFGSRDREGGHGGVCGEEEGRVDEPVKREMLGPGSSGLAPGPPPKIAMNMNI